MNATHKRTGQAIKVIARHEDYAVPMNECRFADGHTGMFKDSEIELTDEHFKRGFEAGLQHSQITVALNNTWGGRTKDGGSTTSYEKIGSHAGSVEFLDGVLASGCKVRQCVERGGQLSSYLLTCNPWK